MLLYLNIIVIIFIENPLDSKEIKSVNPKGNQPQIFIGRTDAEAEAKTVWPKLNLTVTMRGEGKLWSNFGNEYGCAG